MGRALPESPDRFAVRFVQPLESVHRGAHARARARVRFVRQVQKHRQRFIPLRRLAAEHGDKVALHPAQVRAAVGALLKPAAHGLCQAFQKPGGLRPRIVGRAQHRDGQPGFRQRNARRAQHGQRAILRPDFNQPVKRLCLPRGRRRKAVLPAVQAEQFFLRRPQLGFDLLDPRGMLQHISRHAKLHGFLRRQEFVKACQDDEPRAEVPRADPADHLNAAHDGHAKVRQDDVRPVFQVQPVRVLAVCGLRAQRKAQRFPSDHALYAHAYEHFVLHDHHAAHGHDLLRTRNPIGQRLRRPVPPLFSICFFSLAAIFPA